jgi:hypothetical protein
LTRIGKLETPIKGERVLLLVPGTLSPDAVFPVAETVSGCSFLNFPLALLQDGFSKLDVIGFIFDDRPRRGF